MADQNTNTSTQAQNVEQVNTLLQELKERARQSNDEGNVFMLGVYNEILTVASPIVIRAIARLEREEKAAINKAHKNLKKARATSKAPASDTQATV